MTSSVMKLLNAINYFCGSRSCLIRFFLHLPHMHLINTFTFIFYSILSTKIQHEVLAIINNTLPSTSTSLTFVLNILLPV